MAFTNRIAWEPLKSFDTSTLTGSYQKLSTPLEHPSYILKMVNTSSSIVLVSVDGTTDIDILPGGSFFLYDEYKGTQREMLQQGTLFFFRLETGSAATAGNIYVVSQYLITN